MVVEEVNRIGLRDKRRSRRADGPSIVGNSLLSTVSIRFSDSAAHFVSISSMQSKQSCAFRNTRLELDTSWADAYALLGEPHDLYSDTKR